MVELNGLKVHRADMGDKEVGREREIERERERDRDREKRVCVKGGGGGERGVEGH